MKDFITEHFDKFLVSGFMLLSMGLVVLMTFLGFKYPDHAELLDDSFKWATDAWIFFSGLFGGLISGVAAGKAIAAQTQKKQAEEQAKTPTP